MSGLALAYTLHMAATVVWVGGLVVLSVLVFPLVQRHLPPEQAAHFWVRLRRRFDPVAWFCLTLLVGTGMFQMSANPNYEGFLVVANTWARAILLKHIAFLALTVLSAYHTWGLLPALERALLRGGVPSSHHLRRERWWQWGAVGLSLVVLALTAVARAV